MVSAELLAGSIHDVLGKPLAPLCGFLGTQLGIDVDLLLPLRRRGEDTREPGYFRVELGIEHRRAALLQLCYFGLDLRILERVDEFVGEFGLLRTLHDGHGLDTEKGAYFRIRTR